MDTVSLKETAEELSPLLIVSLIASALIGIPLSLLDLSVELLLLLGTILYAGILFITRISQGDLRLGKLREALAYQREKPLIKGTFDDLRSDEVANKNDPLLGFDRDFLAEGYMEDARRSFMYFHDWSSPQDFGGFGNLGRLTVFEKFLEYKDAALFLSALVLTVLAFTAPYWVLNQFGFQAGWLENHRIFLTSTAQAYLFHINWVVLFRRRRNYFYRKTDLENYFRSKIANGYSPREIREILLEGNVDEERLKHAEK